VSVTGTKCDLMCLHCQGHYLCGMRAAVHPEDLLKIAGELNSAGASGLLLSGGSEPTGKVPLDRFTGAVRNIKEHTDLRINAHVGLMARDGLDGLISAGVDSFSVDVYGTDSVVRGTLRLNASAEDFFRVVEDLKDLGAPTVVPHICIGIEGGVLVGEAAAVSRLARMGPDAVVFIVFTPTKGTPYGGLPPPSESDVQSVVRLARERLPETRLVLGCMRPRNASQYETGVIRLGIDGIVMPSPTSLRELKMAGTKIVEKTTCCALG
jgi:uncharacterized radical SAM superfamily protein